jgi:predicted nuclease of predicted toxin-antitoxin system
MTLRLLLDENMSRTIAAQVRRHRPTLLIESVHDWQGGAFRGRADRALLQAARAEGLTLVTYDQRTIPPLLAELYADGENHAGVVFIDDQTIPSNDFGALTRALILMWERFGAEDWLDRIRFLEKPKQ